MSRIREFSFVIDESCQRQEFQEDRVDNVNIPFILINSFHHERRKNSLILKFLIKTLMSRIREFSFVIDESCQRQEFQEDRVDNVNIPFILINSISS